MKIMRPKIELKQEKTFEILITPANGWVRLNLHEVWQRRELIWIFGLRDVAIRYKQTALGILWAIIQPVILMIVFSLVFGSVGGMKSDGSPYAIFSYSGVLPWTLFAASVTAVGSSMINAGQLIKRAYMPRLILLFAACVPPLIDFACAFTVMIGLMTWYRVMPTLAIFAVPIFMLYAVLLALALGIWIAVFNVFYRDFRYILPFSVQILMFLSPVIYPLTIVSEPWRTILTFNPMAAVIEGFRWSILGKPALDWSVIAVSLSATIVLFVGGLIFFRRNEGQFADRI